MRQVTAVGSLLLALLALTAVRGRTVPGRFPELRDLLSTPGLQPLHLRPDFWDCDPCVNNPFGGRVAIMHRNRRA